MIKYFAFAFLLVFLAGCSDKKNSFNGEDEMSLSREEKIRIISEKGYSEDLSQAEAVAEFLKDDDNEVAGQACFFLGYLGARNYIADVQGLLKNDDQDVLNLCLSGLALMVDDRDDYLSDQVLPLVSHESLLVRMSAVEVLGNIQSKKAFGILKKRFDQEAPAVKYEIVRALGKIGNADALPLLRSYQKAVAAMDHSIPRKGGARGSDLHPDVLEMAVTEAIGALEK